MLTIQTEELLSRLRTGKFESSDVELLEHSKADEFRQEVHSLYRWVFQERRLKNKWEVGMAKSIGYELIAPTSPDLIMPMGVVLPVLRNCLFCSGYGDAVSGVSIVSKMILRPIRRPFKGLAIISASGYALDHFLDGWAIVPHEKRTVRLNEDFLLKRGWRFDVIPSLHPLN